MCVCGASRGLSPLGWRQHLTTCWLSINKFSSHLTTITMMDFVVAPASLSRHLNSVAPPPRLFHSIYQPNSSILCLAATESYIFGGKQSGDILVRRTHRRAFGFERNPRYTGLGSSFILEKDDIKRPRGECPCYGVCRCQEMAFHFLWYAARSRAIQVSSDCVRR